MLEKTLNLMLNCGVVAAEDVKMSDGTVADVKRLAPAVDSVGKLGQFAQGSVLVPVDNVEIGI